MSLHLKTSYGTMYRNFFIYSQCILLTTNMNHNTLYSGDNNAKKRNIRARQGNNGIRV